MFYNVAQLLKEPVGSTRTYSIDETIPTGDGNAQDAFRGTVSLLRTDKGIWLSAGLMAMCGSSVVDASKITPIQ